MNLTYPTTWGGQNFSAQISMGARFWCTDIEGGGQNFSAPKFENSTAPPGIHKYM